MTAMNQTDDGKKSSLALQYGNDDNYSGYDESLSGGVATSGTNKDNESHRSIVDNATSVTSAADYGKYEDNNGNMKPNSIQGSVERTIIDAETSSPPGGGRIGSNSLLRKAGDQNKNIDKIIPSTSKPDEASLSWNESTRGAEEPNMESTSNSDPLETATFTSSVSSHNEKNSCHEYYTCKVTGKKKKKNKITSRINFVPQPTTECEKRQYDLNRSKSKANVLEVFDAWTPAQLRESIRSEPLKARVYRTIAIWAGLVHPLDDKNFDRGMKRYQGDEREFDAKYSMHRTEKFGTGYQLHSNSLPFDAYTLMKEAKKGFLSFLVFIYFVVLSSIFASFAWGVDCCNRDVTPGNFLPIGFLLLSGVGDDIIKEPTRCLWVNTLAIFIGVYVSIPLLGAVVLVRLLENRSDLIKSTDVVLLNIRNGVPEITLRVACGNGRSLSNFSATMEATIMQHDTTHDDRYITMIPLELKYSSFLAYFPTFVKHICDENSPLIQNGVVTIDEYGVPSWDKKRVLGLFLSCDADGSRTHVKKYSYSPLTFIEPDEEGRNPFFVNSVPVTTFHWRQFRGSVTPVGDLSKHSEWKYNEKKFRPSSDEKIE